MKQAFKQAMNRKSKFSKAFNRARKRKGALRKAYDKGMSKTQGFTQSADKSKKRSYSATERTRKGWEARKRKYGSTGFKWGSPGGGKYLYRRATTRGVLGRNRRIGKGGGYRRRAGG